MLHLRFSIILSFVFSVLFMVPVLNADTTSNPQKSETLSQRDERIRKSYDRVDLGMNQEQVAALMKEPPFMVKKQSWYYALSKEANSSHQKNWKLIITFERGKVISKEVVYDDYYMTEGK